MQAKGNAIAHPKIGSEANNMANAGCQIEVTMQRYCNLLRPRLEKAIHAIGSGYSD
jgi:hypothetical protein